MELTSSVVAFKQAEMTSRVQYAVARKLLDHQEMQGAAAVKLIEAAGNAMTKSGDDLVAAAIGLGGELDTYG